MHGVIFMENNFFDSNEMETLAREYSKALKCPTLAQATKLYEKIILHEARQLEILGDLSYRASDSALHAVNYLKNLISRSLTLASNAARNENYTEKSGQCKGKFLSDVALLGSIQLDIFVLLDKVGIYHKNYLELAAIENRKCAVIALLR